jgi:excisionase family DNA binding protein
MPKEPLALEVYKPSEVAKMLRVDMRTVYGMIAREELPQIKAGRVIRIPRGPVDALLGRKPVRRRSSARRGEG